MDVLDGGDVVAEADGGEGDDAKVEGGHEGPVLVADDEALHCVEKTGGQEDVK